MTSETTDPLREIILEQLRNACIDIKEMAFLDEFDMDRLEFDVSIINAARNYIKGTSEKSN